MCAAPLRRAFQPEGEVVPAVQSAAASIAAFLPPRRSTVQPSLPLTLPRRRAGRPRQRGLSGPFLPAEGGSPYRLPREASERLALALTPARNRDAAFALARFLARFWSTPSRLLTAFPIDRRALANRPDLGLTEAQVRGAVRALETVGFLRPGLAREGQRLPGGWPGGRTTPQAGAVPVWERVCPPLRGGQQAGCGGPWRAGTSAATDKPSPSPTAVCGPRNGSVLKSPKSKSEAET